MNFLYRRGFHSLRKESKRIALSHRWFPIPPCKPLWQVKTHWYEPSKGIRAAHRSYALDSLFWASLQKGHAISYPHPSLNFFFLNGDRDRSTFSIYCPWIVISPSILLAWVIISQSRIVDKSCNWKQNNSVRVDRYFRKISRREILEI